MSQPSSDLADLSLLSGLAPELATTFVKVASDIALVISDDGVIRNVVEGQVPLRASDDAWVGRAWVDTVTPDTRRKVEMLLHEAQTSGVSRRREVSHPGVGGAAIPVSWAAVRLGAQGPVLAVGRDLRAVAAIQQRFLDAQQEMERDYWRRRQAESRYRLLFQVARDAVLVLDARDFTVIEANPTALALFEARALDGQPVATQFDEASRPAVHELLVTARSSGRPAELRARVAAGRAIAMSATPFRAEERQCLLVRARAVEPMADFFEHMPEAAVITDAVGRIRMANPAFVALCQASDEARLRGWMISDALGDLQRQWPALLAQVRVHGIVGRATVRVQVAGTAPMEAEVSGALLAESDQEDIGFTLRMAAVRSPADTLSVGLTDVVSQLGQAPLPELLVQAVQWAERHLVETALVRSGGRIEAAAQLLGIPTESLVMRLQRLDLAAPGALMN